MPVIIRRGAGRLEVKMKKVFVINGSPRMEKGNTAVILAPFLEGIQSTGAQIELVYASRLKPQACSCGKLYCWNEKPGECCIHDGMQQVYPRLRESDILVIATPVYIPLPGDLQNFLNRLVALMDPVLTFQEGRTRIRFRPDVNIRKFVLVASSGWWELENFDTVIRIVREMALDAGVEFTGAILRPHFQSMQSGGVLTAAGESVVAAIREAGRELILTGGFSTSTLEQIQRPLVSCKDYYGMEG